MTTDLAPLRAGLSSGLVALDFDGTLAPISPRPRDARPLAGAAQLLRDVRATGATRAIVTGRTVASLLRVSHFGAIPGIVIYGTHGAQRWQGVTCAPRRSPRAWTSCARACPGCWPASGADVTVPDPPALMTLLRQILRITAPAAAPLI